MHDTKKILQISIAALLALSSCKKEETCSNTVTIKDGNTDYLFCGNTGEYVSSGTQMLSSVSFHKGIQGSVLTISSYSSAFSLHLQDSTGAAGIGTFAVRAADSNTNTYSGSVGGWQPYKCSGGTITVDRMEAGKASGTFSLNVFNATGSKTITGTFDANKPTIVE